MYNIEYILDMVGLLSLTAAFVLAFMLVLKIDKVKRLQITVDKLKRSLDEMDEQAKLIVRTDIELNKTQEELDEKITGLYTLQKLSRAISTTLQEQQIFKKIEATHLEDLGFEKALACLWNEQEKKFLLHLNIGYFPDEVKIIQINIDTNKGFYLDLIEKEKTISSISIPDTLLREKLNNIFKTPSWVISPILSKGGQKGFLSVGTESKDVTITAGDEESITILGNQIGQALENARLFEQTWQAQQDLEKKVDARTQELKLALEEVQKASKRKSDFVSSVSHELRTPLTSIKGYASILLAGQLGELPEEIRSRLDKINRHSDELTHLVNDLLDISCIESGRVVMKQASQDLKSIIEGVSDLLSMQLKEKGLELQINLAAEATTLFVDRPQIERVFINIIGNAIKFTPLKGKITLRSHKLDGQLQVDISDTGCGIPAEAQNIIFEEFYRVDNPINQKIKGTGLGLALVKHIIEAHGGKIWVKSKPHEGSTFSFTLPLSSV